MREIVLSGFQLELYAKEEKAFAYWYTACILELHMNCLHALMPTLVQGKYFILVSLAYQALIVVTRF